MSEYHVVNKQAYDLVANYYQKEHATQIEWEEELATFASYITGNNPEIIDLGCGFGQEADWLRASIEGAIVSGVDFSEQMISLAQKNFPGGTFMCSDMVAYIHPVAVSGIWARASLHHLTEQELDECFQSMGRYILTGGTIGMVNKAGSGEGVEEKMKYSQKLSRYFNYFSDERIKTIADKYGYSVIEQYSREEGGHSWLVSFLRKLA